MNLKIKTFIVLNFLLLNTGKCVDVTQLKDELKSDDISMVQNTLVDFLNNQGDEKLLKTIITEISPELITLSKHKDLGIRSLSSYTLCFSDEFNPEVVQALIDVINNTQDLDIKQMVLSGLARVPKSLVTDNLEAVVLDNLKQDEDFLSFNSAMIAASELSLLKAIPILESKLLDSKFDTKKNK